MINIVLDTNVYRKNPFRSDLPFQALARLAKAGLVKVYLPYLVEREFQTYRRSLCQKDISSAESALSSLLKKELSPTSKALVEATLSDIKEYGQSVLDDAEQSLLMWANEIGAIRQELTFEQSKSALEAYFQGSAPLTEPKKRNDIPDSFIYQAVKAIPATSPLVVISEDGKLADAMSLIEHASTFTSLAAFIEKESTQALIVDLDVTDKLPQIISIIEQHQAETNDISSAIEGKIGDSLVNITIHSSRIPDDNNEATVSGYNDAEDIELHFDDASYFGNGEIGLPFSLSLWVSAYFYIYKPDYYAMDFEFSVTDHSDHYFQAEDEFFLSVSGTARISVPMPILLALDADEIAGALEVTIDSVEQVEVN
ncbi:PIN domain-containing protein [Stenotrophomonas sp. DR822]|uniref:PIN domain-containing protein n=1 Tax=Stenotrophomonas sp. DR822 TaxID=2871174 RepID=UPI001C96BCF6|nr:PIN domain-containing protein [Stenotrophomonas sp. DR822]QZN82109.1 PIN domain-containing protein [Stenotrophomonas sp. DR822]